MILNDTRINLLCNYCWIWAEPHLVLGLPGTHCKRETVLELNAVYCLFPQDLDNKATAEGWRLACFLGLGLLYVCIFWLVLVLLFLFGLVSKHT